MAYGSTGVTHWRSIIPILVVWLSSCTTGTVAWDQANWIEVGRTTKAQVVDRYGEPDIARSVADGAIATYFPTLKFPPPPPALPTIQTMQPSSAGFGVAMANHIEPRLAVRDGGARGPRQGLSIRYDAQGVVAAILPE
jgi:hypothetical protein